MNNIVGQDTQSLQVALISTKQQQIYLECGKKEACKMNKIDKKFSQNFDFNSFALGVS